MSDTYRGVIDLVSMLHERASHLREPYITRHQGEPPDAAWFLHRGRMSDSEQVVLATRIIDAMGGTWEVKDRGEVVYLEQDAGTYTLAVSLDRAAYCGDIAGVR